MPFKKLYDTGSSTKLSSTLTGVVTEKDQQEFIQWIITLSSSTDCKIIFDHQDESINKNILCFLLDNFGKAITYKASIIVMNNVTKKLGIYCSGIKIFDWFNSYITNDQKKIETINFNAEPTLEFLKYIINQKTVQKFSCTEFIWDKENKNIKFLNISDLKMYPRMIDIINLFETRIEVVEFDYLLTSVTTWQELTMVTNRMTNCQFKVKNLRVPNNDHRDFTKHLIENFNNTNWQTTGDNNIVTTLVTRNLLIKNIENEIKDNKIQLSGLCFTEKHFDIIDSFLNKQKELEEIDLSKNNFDLESIFPKILNSEWVKNITLKIDDIVLKTADGKICLLQIDFKNYKLINAIKNTSFSVEKFIFNNSDKNQKNTIELLPIIENNQRSHFQLRNFSNVAIDNKKKHELAEKLKDFQKIEFETHQKTSSNVNTKEAFPDLSKENTLEKILLCIARRNILLMKINDNRSLEEISDLMKCLLIEHGPLSEPESEPEPTPTLTELDLPSLLLKNEHLDSIFKYVISNLNVCTLNLSGNTLKLSKLFSFTEELITEKRTIDFKSNTFFISIKEGAVQFLVINSYSCTEVAQWWQAVNPIANELKLEVTDQTTQKTPEFLQKIISLLDLVKPVLLSLKCSSKLIAEKDFINLIDKTIINKTTLNIETDAFFMDVIDGKIDRIGINSSAMLSFLNLCVDRKYQVEKVIIGEILTKQINTNLQILTQITSIIEAWQYNTKFNIIPTTEKIKSVIDEKILSNFGNQLTSLSNVEYNNPNDKYNLQSFGNILSRISYRNEILKKLEKNVPVLRENQTNQHMLDLHYLWLIDKQIPTILNYLEKNEEIQEVILDCNNEISSNGLIQLFEGLKNIPWITSLSLVEIGISLDLPAVKKLGEYLRCGFLLKLKINKNDLMDITLIEIINIIRQNKSLFSLDIRENNFTADHNITLAQALCVNRSLTTFLFDKISTVESLDTFFTTIGWKLKATVKKTSKFNYSLEEIEVLDSASKEYINHEFKTRGLDSEVKNYKKIIENYKKYIAYGNEKKNEINSSLVETAHEGKDIGKFKKLLENASPYTLAQSGYLQHILTDTQDPSFLQYLFDSFNINPWLRFNEKTILDLAKEKKNESLAEKIEQWMDKLKNPGKISFNTQDSSQSKKHKLPYTESSSPKKTKNEGKTEVAENTLLVGSEKMDSDDLMVIKQEASTPQLNESFSFLNSNVSANIPLIMQLIFMQQDNLLKKQWQLETSKEFFSFTQKTPLKYALAVKATQCVGALIKLGENINKKNENGLPLLYQFVSDFYEHKHSEQEADQHIHILEILLKNGASVKNKVTTINIKQDTVMHLAVRMGNYRTVKMLLNAIDCPVNEENSVHLTPLKEAINIRNTKLVARLLLDRRHTRSTIVNAKKDAISQKFSEIKPLLEHYLNTIVGEVRTSGMQWSTGLYVHFKKASNGNKPIHTVSLEEEHAWLHTQNSFLQQALTIFDQEEGKNKLKQLGNPVTASLTFVLTASPHQRHMAQKYVDITIPLDDVPNFHLVEAFNETEDNNSVNNLEREAVVASQQVLDILPHYHNFRQGYQPRDPENIRITPATDFNQTFRHGERSLTTYLSTEQHVLSIVKKLTQKPGFVMHAKLKGVILNIASPRYVCENCEVALLATQNAITSKFLPILKEELMKIGIQLPLFHKTRMITCVSSFIPFNADRISGASLLDIDIRDNDVILTKDITQVSEKVYTQFKSNQL